MTEVKAVSSHIVGSMASKMVMRNEIQGLTIDQGIPCFYITINPADTFNPLVRFLAGEEIDVDRLLPDHLLEYLRQKYLVAKNPFMGARFFNIYMKVFISSVLSFCSGDSDLEQEGGALGHVKAYYGCVEAQGHGTLHCHMLVWLEGGMNPNEIKDQLQGGDSQLCERLLAFLDDMLSTCVPDPPSAAISVPSSRYHPSSVRGVEGILDDNAVRKDLYHLIRKSQIHKHSGTCYKYRPSCRFDMDKSNYVQESSFDPATGELCLQRLDGMVNDFNETIIRCICCNTGIKFIGSGASAKAVLYYITDYITKSRLKANVAYAALELSVRKLAEFDPKEDDLMS